MAHIDLIYDDVMTISHLRAFHLVAEAHVHLDHHLCSEMIMVKGRAKMIRELAESLGQQKGVLHANLTVSSTGKKLA